MVKVRVHCCKGAVTARKLNNGDCQNQRLVSFKATVGLEVHQG